MVCEEEKFREIETTSWKSGKYDLFFYGLTRGYRPTLCVELGTYAGFSAYWTALALRHNGFGRLHCYDMWEKYPFKHVSMNEAKRNLKGLPVKLVKTDVRLVHQGYKNNSVDLLIVDISNDGDKYKYLLSNWYSKLSAKALVVMEGGSKERDSVEWMTKYKKSSIREALGGITIKQLYRYNVINFFPGVTLLEKK